MGSNGFRWPTILPSFTGLLLVRRQSNGFTTMLLLFVCLFFLPTGDVNEFQCQGLDCFQSIFESADQNLQFFPRVKVKK